MAKVITFYRPTGEWGELSNFYVHKSLVVVNGRAWTTAEHYFQAQKATNQKDYMEIWACRTAREAKRLGQLVKLPAKWEEVKEEAMLRALIAKFDQDRHCRDVLIRTGDALLIEDGYDQYWGEQGGVGLNRLGQLLAHVRTFLQSEKK